MSRFNRVSFAILVLSVISLTGCQQLTINTEKLVKSDVDLKEIVGLLTGFGTTFAALPDLIAMLKRRSSLGMNPRIDHALARVRGATACACFSLRRKCA
jgi:MtN3 and saliva related transmembrane protein